MRTRTLIVLFFGLYFVVAIGIATQPPETALSAEEMLIAVAGAVVLAVIFLAAAEWQRRDLRAFVEGLFTDATRL
jgi:protein-S-isoprenylcysteine O-methyltransferase Ste14